MNKLLNITLLACLVLNSCTMKTDKNAVEKWKQEILATEQSFAKMVKEEGIHQAFITYAAEDAVLMRNNELVLGKKNISLHYEKQTSKNLIWVPDFVDVALSGDLGYTYGHYTFSYTDPDG